MATSGKQVFEITMALVDALSNGVADHAGTADYKARMTAIINNMLPELYQYSDTRTDTEGYRPTPAFIADLSELLDLDDALARGVLVHGAAAELLAEENPALASYHEQKYLEKLSRLRNTPARTEPIEDLYGISDYSEQG